MTRADVSVIIPAYNNADTIHRALASVAAQTLRPAQVVVVDDGSVDGTAQAAQACQSFLDGIELKIIRQSNQGAGAARNKAVEAATGAFVAFLDADDQWLPEKVARSVEQLQDPDILYVSHDVMVRNSDGSETIRDCARHFNSAADPYVALSTRGFVGTSTVVARRQAVLEAGGFEPSLRAAQDHDLWLRLAARGRFCVFPGALMIYTINPSGITANVRRRRVCAFAVLIRNLSELIRHKQGVRAAFTRAAIVHVEAALAYRDQNQPVKAILELAAIPLAFLRIGSAIILR